MNAKIKGFVLGLLLGMILTIALWFYLTWSWYAAHPYFPYSPPGCTGFSQAHPIGWNASSTSKMILLTINNYEGKYYAGANIKLEQVNVTIFDRNCKNRTDLNKNLVPGENYTINITECVLPEIGEYYKADIWIVYTNLKSNISRDSRGECHGFVQE